MSSPETVPHSIDARVRQAAVAVLDSDAYRDALARLLAEAYMADLSDELTPSELTTACRRIAAEVLS